MSSGTDSESNLVFDQVTSTSTLFSMIRDDLSLRIKKANTSVYEADEQTRSDVFQFGDAQLVTKREDTSLIHSYKWRGAYFKIQQAIASGYDGEFVAASAGNHAQGVALAANRLRVPAIIFMPTTTPALKQQAVKHFGQEHVDVRLVGDCYDDASAAAFEYLETNKAMMVRPFDDLDVIAGQATVGLELMKQHPGLTKVYLPVGGGGLAAGVAFAIKQVLGLSCKVIGVEVEKQNSMQLSKLCGQPIVMDSVDTFCDGTAVQRPGKFTFEICRQLLDDVLTVNSHQVCSAIQSAWEVGRFVPEPSGAIALAKALENAEQDRNEIVAVVISGSNMDFRTFPKVVSRSASNLSQRRYFRFEIKEESGALIRLLDQFMADLNIVDFQYGKDHRMVARPVLGLEGPSTQLNELVGMTDELNIKTVEISGSSFSEFRVIPFRLDLYTNPIFLKVGFPNRPGALRELMRRISATTNICYFNFVESGELEGYALIGFELLDERSEGEILKAMVELGLTFDRASLGT